MELLKLKIQMFAEDTGATGEGNTQPVAGDNATPVSEKPLSFDDMLGSNKEYQAEFDRRINKGLETAKSKWEADYKAKLEAQKNEAEKLAQMDAEQKAKYEAEKMQNRIAELESQINADKLYKTANSIASEKGLPQGYLNLIDFSKETAESINSKIDSLIELRNADLKAYLNDKLKQPTPQEKKKADNVIDPYIEGFKSEF